MPLLFRAFALVGLALTIVGGTVIGAGVRRVNRIYDIPSPPIARATQPAEIARGGRLFRTVCLDCHAGGGKDRTRATGGRVGGAPDTLGSIYAPNLTNDQEAGIGALPDAAIARLLRNGLRADGRYAAGMPRFARLSDADVAALIGFLRSDDPLVAAAPNRVPPTELGLAGKLILAYSAGVDTSGPPAIPAPARGATAEYGAYLASSAYGCVDCHTDGYEPASKKLRSPALLAGGFLLRTPRGEPLLSSNLTPDVDTGLGRWTPADFRRAVTAGVRPDGAKLRAPMPVFHDLDDSEVAALFAYLRTVPAVRRDARRVYQNDRRI